MEKYQLLQFHMSCNPNYMFGHAAIAGMLATNSEEVNTYDKYVKACRCWGIEHYKEELYNQFMNDCKRRVIVAPSA